MLGKVVTERWRVQDDGLVRSHPKLVADTLSCRLGVRRQQFVIARVSDLEDLWVRVCRREERSFEEWGCIAGGGHEVVPLASTTVIVGDLGTRESTLFPPVMTHDLVGVAVHGLDHDLPCGLGKPIQLVDVHHVVARPRDDGMPFTAAFDHCRAAFWHWNGTVTNRPE